MSEDINAIDVLGKNYPTKISLDEKDSDMLTDEVNRLVKEDLKAMLEIRKLLKTDETYSNSIGNLYFYLMDKKVCDTCCGKLSSCEKKNIGYQYRLTYDSERDEIKPVWMECSLMKNALSILGRIHPTTIPVFDSFICFNQFLSAYSDVNNRKKMIDVSNLIFSDTVKKIHDFDKNAHQTGYAIYALNSETLAKRVMKAICFMFAKSGFHVGYMNLNQMFENLQSRDYSLKEDAIPQFNQVCSVPVLFVEDILDLPFMNNAFLTEYFLPLLKARSEVGKLTYCNLSSNVSLENSISNRFRQTDHYKEAKELVKSIFMTRNIKDFDIL